MDITRSSGDWVVYKLSSLFTTVDHHVKIHKITPVVGKEHGDIEIKIKDYVVLLYGDPLIHDFTMTHDRFGRWCHSVSV